MFMKREFAGATINEPCVNKSEQNACIYGEEIYIGLSFVKELEYKLVKKIHCAIEQKRGFMSI